MRSNKKFSSTCREIISYKFQKPYLCIRYYLINIIYNTYFIPITAFIEHLSCAKIQEFYMYYLI